MEDKEIIALFFERSDNAITELQSKYGVLCFAQAFNILQSKEDAEECVNDAYLSFWNAVPPKNPDPLPPFLLRLVRNISLNRYKHNAAEKRNGRYDACLDELLFALSSGETAEDGFEAEERARELTMHLEAFLDSQSKTNRMLFVRRYWYSDSLEALARYTGLSQSVVSTRLSRIRQRLKHYLTEKGVTL